MKDPTHERRPGDREANSYEFLLRSRLALVAVSGAPIILGVSSTPWPQWPLGWLPPLLPFPFPLPLPLPFPLPFPLWG